MVSALALAFYLAKVSTQEQSLLGGKDLVNQLCCLTPFSLGKVKAL